MQDTPETDAGHVPVLTAPVLEFLAPRPGEVCLDCTIGRGGHASLILPRLSPGGRYVGLDADPANVGFCRDRLADSGAAIQIVHSNFAAAGQVLGRLGIDRVDMLLADLGFASCQMNDPSRGLSFAGDDPLDMRYDPATARCAADLVNELDEQELADLIFTYGQERHSRKIARKIGEARRQSPIKTTRQLAQIVRQACHTGRRPAGRGRRSRGVRIDPATRTFMALRIAVNGELEALGQLLDAMPGLLKPGGRAAVISFHSLEDRPVKQAFARWHREGLAERLTRRIVTADEHEQRANPRSRSAKLRAIRWNASMTLDST
jgi:16S rRNA (cytosine1402-N4)-methyltransferase